MKLLGTAIEWYEKYPEVFIRNDKILGPKGMALKIIKIYDEPIMATCPLRHPNDKDIFIYIGKGPIGPYMVKLPVKYACIATNYDYGAAGGNYLSEKQANDPNWYKWEMEDYYEIGPFYD